MWKRGFPFVHNFSNTICCCLLFSFVVKLSLLNDFFLSFMPRLTRCSSITQRFRCHSFYTFLFSNFHNAISFFFCIFFSKNPLTSLSLTFFRFAFASSFRNHLVRKCGFSIMYLSLKTFSMFCLWRLSKKEATWKYELSWSQRVFEARRNTQ